MSYRVNAASDLTAAKNLMSYITSVINAYGYVTIKMLDDCGARAQCLNEDNYPSSYGWISDRDLEVYIDDAKELVYVEFRSEPKELVFNRDGFPTVSYISDSVLDDFKDMVNHPEHYKHNGIETIDVIDAWLSAIGKDAIHGYYTGNCIKYLSRWNDKGGVEDLKKCRWYLDRLIGKLDEEAKK